MCRSLILEMSKTCLSLSPGTRFLILFAALFLLPGADGCPLSMDNTPPQADGGNNNNGPTMDIGGPGGAFWILSYSKELVVTVRTSNQVASKKTTTSAGTLSILNGTINISGFCSRSDTLCPDELLPDNTVILQTAEAPASPVIGFNRQGPLLIIKNQPGLYGILTGDALKVPLATNGLSAAKGDHCALVPPSAIQARARNSSGTGDGNRADTLEGSITMAYGSDCFNLGGGSSLQTNSKVELSMAFSAKRKLGI